MDEKELREFIKKVANYSLEIVDPEEGIDSRTFEKSLLEKYIFPEFPFFDFGDLKSIYNVFHWGLISDLNAPLEYTFLDDLEGNSRIYFRNNGFDKDEVAQNIFNKYKETFLPRVDSSFF